MRFLTRKWVEGAYDSNTTELHYGVYLRHLEDILSDMPAPVRTLAIRSQGLLLMGRTVIATQYDAARKSFTLILKVDGLGAEFYLQLEYIGVTPDTSDLEPLNFAKECLTEEFDVGPDESIEHRILLKPDGEAVIRFKDLKFHAKRNDEDGDE